MNERGILIVEDENIVALDMRMRLESMGYHVLGVVDTGEDALDFIARNRPALVLMDIKLKGGSDGIETARKARETIEVPIIFVTAFTDEGTLERAKLASPYGYVVKPFHERELRIAIELALYKFQYELSMRRSMEIAEEANKAKGEFLANVSHELKTPLNSIIGFTELSLDISVNEEQREYLSGVIRSARSLVTLIDSILDFARLENGRLSPVQSSFSLDDLLGECVEFLAVGATSRNLEIFFRRDRRLPEYLVSDRSRIRQILMNLADNAVKFTEHGHISLAVDLAPPSALAEAKGKGAMGSAVMDKTHAALLLRLVVEDSGIGMPPDKIPKAFERFTQLDGSTTRPAGGTGIGLAIVAKSIDLLGGAIQVQSAPGKGSRFEVLIPIHGDESRRSASHAEFEGRMFFLVGFGQEARLDIEETLAWLGALAEPKENLSDALASLEGRDGAFIIANEVAAAEDPAALSALRGRLVITCRPGFAGRAELTSIGIGIVPYPLRAAPLVATLAALSSLGTASKGKAARLSHVPAFSPQPRPASRANPSVPAAKDGSPEEGKAELWRFLVVLEACAASRDINRLEMSCKEFRDIFRSMRQDAWEKLAFSALLLSRKGDWKGLENVMEKGHLLVDGKN